MLEGIYAAAAGMAAQQDRLDALSNDLANISTPGYQGERVAFRDLLYTPSGAGSVPGVGSGAGAAVTSLGRNSAEGSLQNTGQPFDVALVGSGYLAVNDAAGRTFLTREGSLQRRVNGLLTTPSGLSTGVRIPAGVTDDQVTISPNGTVTAAGRTVGRLRIVNVAAPDQLVPQGNGVFGATAASGAPRPAGAGTTVQQHSLESSNVDLADAMTQMIDAQRGYQMVSKVITTQDQLLQIANGIKR